MALSDAEVAIAAAQAGAAVARARFGTALARFDKTTLDFATDADVDAEKAILGVLQAERPGDAFQGEELGAIGDTSDGRTWLVDPLCGTLNFAAQTPLFVVNVALRKAGAAVAAAGADPMAGEVFWTDGRAAHVRRGGSDEPLVPSPASRLVDVDLDPSKPDNDRFRPTELLASPRFTAAYLPRVISTSLAVVWVAAGRRAAYIAHGGLADSVHFAAGVALCQAAGCVVTGLRGQPLRDGEHGLVAAADAQTHAELIDIINEQFSPQTPL
jgi:myo-inositol-1(or 4)-monophosphatase